ncbi:hypothetical protein ScPMuIL_006854 [Solemya velum]
MNCPANIGSRFVVVYIGNRLFEADNYMPQLYLATPLLNDVVVSITTPTWQSTDHVDMNVTLSPGNMTLVELPSSLLLSETGIYNKTVRIVANEIILAATNNARKHSVGSSLALSVDVLGRDYFLVSGGKDACAGVVAVQSNTHVILYLPEHYSGTLTYAGVDYSAGDALRVKLSKYEVFHWHSLVDFTGTRVISNKPVAVFSGNRWLRYVDTGKGDHMEEQLIPVPYWVSQYVILTASVSVDGEYVRVIASEEDTTIVFRGTTIVLEKPGAFHQFFISLNERLVLTSSKPVLVYQFSIGCELNAILCDSFMLLSTAPDHFSQSVDFVTPAVELEQVYTHRLTITTERYSTNNIFLDGKQVDSDWVDIHRTRLSTRLCEVPPGHHKITSDVEDTKFGGFVDGFGKSESYALPLTLTFSMEELPPCTDMDCRSTFHLLRETKCHCRRP